MPIYSYSSLNDKGRQIRGQMSAANEMDLEERLKVIGLDLINSKELKSGKKSFALTGVAATIFFLPFMKVVSSIKSAKLRHPACQVVRRKGRIYVINKVEPRYKARQG